MKTDKETGAGPHKPEIDSEPDTAPPETEDKRVRQLEAENGELKAAIREARAREMITTHLRECGARTPALLFDAIRGDLQFAEDGSVANAEALAKRLQREFPEQFGPNEPVSIDGGAGRAVPSVLTKDALRKMTAAEIAKLDWASVKQALRDR